MRANQMEKLLERVIKLSKDCLNYGDDGSLLHEIAEEAEKLLDRSQDNFNKSRAIARRKANGGASGGAYE